MENVDYVITNIKNEKESVRKEIQVLNLELADVERDIELYKIKIREAEAARAQKKQVKEEIIAHIESCTDQFAKIKLQTQQLVQSTHKRQVALSNFKLANRAETPALVENGTGRAGTSKGTRTLSHVASKLEKIESFEIEKSEKAEKSDKSEKLSKSNSELNTGQSKVVPSSSKSDLIAKNEASTKNESEDTTTKGTKKQRQKKASTLEV